MAFESYGVAMASLSTISSRRSSMDLDLQLDDEEALKWAAIERLSSTRSKSIRSCGNAEDILDVVNLGGLERRDLLERVLRVVEEDNEKLLRRILQRINAVGIELPTIEVRFENLFVNAKISVGSRAQPTNWNFIMNSIETVLEGLHLRASKRRDFTILNNVSGIIKPSRMTLLLGSPGSGKSTLLLALAGKLDPNLKAKGRVTYNGHDFNEFIPQKTSAYISQHDVHMGEMTVRQVLDFSARCQGVGNRYDMFSELCKRERDAGIKPDPVLDALLKAATMQGQQESIVTDYILKVLGLEFCADTLVGDNMQRGISGGQKKRVTIGEMIVGPAKALFMDEISTGLDSATTFQIVKYLRQTVHALGITLLVSLLQPSPETFELFDDIILLSEGHIIYQGPRESVLDYFISKGFKCPERKNIADFVQEVTSIKDQKQYWADRTTPYCYVPVKTFADDFSSFHLGKALDDELKQPYDKTKSHPAALSTQKYGLAKWELLKACFSREWSLMKSNSSIYIFLFIKLLLLALVTMSVFFRTTMKHDTVQDGNKYQGALFFGLLNIMFNSFVELALTVKNLPVFYKQRDSFFYPAWAWSVPSTILRIPVSLMETAIWVFVSYWTIGFAPEIGRFFQQFIVLFMVSQMAQNIFRFLAGVGRNMLIASTFGNLALMLVFIMGGFIISRDDIPAWWIWSYWISPMMYGQNAIGANEFLAKRWQKSSNDSTLTIGEQVLRSRGLFANESWVWLGLGAEFGFAILFNIGFMVALTYLKPLSKSQAPLSEKLLAEKLATRTGVNVSNYSSSICELEDAKGLSTQNSRNIGKKEGFTKGMTLPFEPYTLAFDHINYYVDMPKQMRQEVVEERLQLLSDASGVFRPGVLTALMGISGAGKTTLMDVLAGRKTAGYIEGSIMISGYPKKQETFARISGYCEQNDVHSPNLTVYESLYYSAWLRLTKEVDVKTRKLFVHEIMELVELTPLEGALVGLPGVMGLSTEQRKRLTIAVELVANPSIIFMDEPTSGLDARAAAIVMRTVRNTVNTGRTVVCTIHQPSIEIFEAFDELILMKRGGQIIYGGPLGTHSNLLVNYFEAVESIPKIPDGYNPATWMLEVTSEEVEARIGVDFVELYKSSPVYQQNQTFIKEASVPPAGSQDLYFATKYSQPFLTQLRACLWKQNLSYASNPHYVAIRMLFSMVTAVIFGSMFWNLGSKRGTQQDIFNVMGAMYSAVLFVGFNNATGVLEVILVERTVYYREKGAGMYSALPYTLAQVIIELPYILAQSLGFGVILYAMMNLEWTAAKFFWFLFFMFCTFSYMTFYGMVSAAITPDNQVASIIILACYSFWNLFAGFVITHNALPIWWKWCYWASPPAWSLYGLVTSQLGDVQTLISIPGEGQKSVATYLDDYFGYKKDFLGVVGGLHVALVLIFALIYIAAIKYLNFQKR